MFDNSRNQVMELSTVYCDFISIRSENMFLAEYKYENHPVFIRGTISDIGRSTDGEAFVDTKFKYRNARLAKDMEVTVRCLLKDPYSKCTTKLRVGFLATINGYFSAKRSADKDCPNHVVLTKCEVYTGCRDNATNENITKVDKIECPCLRCLGLRYSICNMPDVVRLKNIENKINELTNIGLNLLKISEDISKTDDGCGELICAKDGVMGAYSIVKNLHSIYVEKKFKELSCCPCKYYREG